MLIKDSPELSKWKTWVERIHYEVQEALIYNDAYWEFKHDIREVHSESIVRSNNIFYDMVGWGYAYQLFLTIRKQTAYSSNPKFSEITLLRLLHALNNIEPSKELQADIDYLSNDKKLKICRKYVNKYMAHADETGPEATTFRDGIETIEKIWELTRKYYGILTGVWVTRMVVGYNWKRIFEYKWIEN